MTKTTISFWLNENQIVNSIYLEHYANAPYKENDIIYFKVEELYPRILENWKTLYKSSKIIDSAIKVNTSMIEKTRNKSFKVVKVFNQIQYSPILQELGHNATFIYEYYLEEVKEA